MNCQEDYILQRTDYFCCSSVPSGKILPQDWRDGWAPTALTKDPGLVLRVNHSGQPSTVSNYTFRVSHTVFWRLRVTAGKHTQTNRYTYTSIDKKIRLKDPLTFIQAHLKAALSFPELHPHARDQFSLMFRVHIFPRVLELLYTITDSFILDVH